MASPNLQGLFKLAQRPVHTISNRKGEDFELKTDAKGALIFVKDCTDCHASLLEKAAKVLVEDCNNLVLDVKSTLYSGLLEIVSCNKVVLNLLEGGQVRKRSKIDTFYFLPHPHCRNVLIFFRGRRYLRGGGQGVEESRANSQDAT